MKTKLLFIWILLVVTNVTLQSQVTISPEVGWTSSPYKLISGNTITEIAPSSLFLGLSTNLTIYKKWMVRTRVSFAKRENARWMDRCLCPAYQYSEYQHDDLGVDFSIVYPLKPYLQVGLGASFIKKLNSVLIEVDEEAVFFDVDEKEFGLHVLLSGKIAFFWISLQYLHKTRESDVLFYFKEGKARTDLTLAIPIFRSKKE